MYVKIKNNQVEQYPYNLTNLTSDFPTTSFPESLTNASLESFNIFKVVGTVNPTVLYYQNLRELPPKLVEGNWTQQWEVFDLSEEDLNEKKAFVSRVVREERSQRLKDSDWAIMLDSPLTNEEKQKFIVYRQELRDVPLQPEFPWNVTWPTIEQ
jgi:hypothetical protein